MEDSKDHKAAAEPLLECGVRGWQPIATAPENTEMLCYCPEYEPHYFVARFTWATECEDVLVSARGKRKTYETVETRVREWGQSESYGASFWMPLPEAPNVELTGAARLYRAASSDRRERG